MQIPDELLKNDAFSTTSKVLLFLAAHPDQEFSKKDIAAIVGVIDSNVGSSLRTLRKRNLVTIRNSIVTPCMIIPRYGYCG